jgi:branched-chain amino acid transport system substrate-binding protein
MKRFRKVVAAGGLAVALAASVAACGSDSASSGGSAGASTSSKPVVLGVQAPFTGDYAIYGEAYKRGIETWKAQHGGKLEAGGHPITVKEIDDGCDVKTGISAFRKNSADLSVLMGPACSSVVEAVKPLARASQVPVMFLGQAASLTVGQTDGWLFRLTQPDTANAQAFGKYVIEDWKAKWIAKIAVLHDTSVLDKDAAKTWGGLAGPAGMKIVADQSFDLGATDFTSAVLKVKQSGAEAVVIQTYGPEEARIIKQMADLKIKIPIAAGTDTAYPSTIKAAGPAIEGAAFYSDYIAGSDLTALKGFETAFVKLYPDREPENTDYEAWLGMALLSNALEQPGAADSGDALRKALAGAKVDLGGVEQSYAANGDQSTVLTFVATVKNGKPAVTEVLKDPRSNFGG